MENEIDEKVIAPIKTKGILLVAAGHPYYGKMAAALAASIKTVDAEAVICVVKAGRGLAHLTDDEWSLFDSVIDAPADSYTIDGVANKWIKIKTRMYDLSPFDETLYLDVDMVWMHRKKVSEIFAELEPVDFTIQNRGHIDLSEEAIDEKYSQWLNVSDVKEMYKIESGKYYSLHSEFVYFKKSEANKKYFNAVKKIYDKPKIETVEFAGAAPDEFAFAIACILMKKYPHEDKYLPVYWHYLDPSNQQTSELSKFYCAYSVGGNILIGDMKKNYDRLARVGYNHFNLSYPFEAMDKKAFLTERNKF